MTRYTATFVLAGLMSAGCGGGPPSAQSSLPFNPSLHEQSPTREQTIKRGFAVAEQGSNVVRIYPPHNRQNKPPVCTVPASGVQDITSDAKGDLYVPNGDGTVVEYAPSCGAPIQTWHEHQGQPDDVTVFGKTVYVATLGTGEKAGDIAVCTSTCDGVLKDRVIALLFGIAVDAQGNVWAAVSSSGANAALMVWRGGKMPGHIVTGNIDPDLTGLDFANDGTLLLVDEFRPGVYTYSCDAAAAKCRELGHWPLKYGGFFGKLDKANTQFQVANNGTGEVDVYAYPGFAFQYSYNNGLNPNDNVDGITAFPI
ncbi:MAG TPA: hypothetical protein VIW73_09285 [Candidatus Cybelea sp.]